MAIEVTTNNQPRDILQAYELTADEREKFDYYDWDKVERGEDSASFFRYKGQTYDLGEFERWDNPSSPLNAGNWDDFSADTYFSGILVRYVEDYEQVVVARYFVSSDLEDIATLERTP